MRIEHYDVSHQTENEQKLRICYAGETKARPKHRFYFALNDL